MKKMLFIDADSCSGCLSCVTTCSQANQKVSGLSSSRIHVDLAPFSGRYTPEVCLQCQEAPCAEACPVGAIRMHPTQGYWDIDYETCIGCKQCIAACPLGVMFYDPVNEQVIKCHTCHGDPVCAKVCPTDAIVWGEVGVRENYRKRKIVARAT